MKFKLLTSLCSIALALVAYGQDPTASPATSPATPFPTATATAPATAPSPAPALAASATPDDRTALERKIEDKVKKHFQVTIGDDDVARSRHHGNHDSDVEDAAGLMAIPIVGIIFTTLFGAPVMIVGLIMFFSYWKSRSLHRTVRTMVEKGQEVPPALFAGPPPVIRARSDMRRGVVLIMIGIGVMIFFGAVNDWEGGSWAIGVIPFLIGAGYLLVWKLEGHKITPINTSTDNVPRVP
jgi:hypothetical protein